MFVKWFYERQLCFLRSQHLKQKHHNIITHYFMVKILIIFETFKIYKMSRIRVTVIEGAPKMMKTMKSEIGPVLEKFGKDQNRMFFFSNFEMSFYKMSADTLAGLTETLPPPSLCNFMPTHTPLGIS